MTSSPSPKEVPVPNLRDASAEAHRTTVESSIADIVAFLREVFGQKLVAYMAGVSESRTVSRWAAGESPPRAASEDRLRHAYYIFRLLNTEESPHTVRAWFVGLNPQLDDESPASAIRDDRPRDVLVAAKAFLAGG
jgi:hypothetical protein